MMRRLEHGGRIARERVLNFTFNGRVLRGFAGDTLASALLANGVDLVARSWKYHRPRGVLSAGVEEPNALVQLFEGGRTVPNARATEVELVDGLVARSVNAHPSVEFDARALNGWFSRLMPAGFYYKTFMASQAAWHFFERHIRRASGLGEAPVVADAGRYDKRFAHCDVLIVGGGIAGLCAALAAGRTGARVVVCDEQSEPGGWLLSSDEPVDGLSAAQWVARSLARLAEMPEVRVLSRTTAFGYHDHDFVTLAERRADHLPVAAAPAVRERLWKVRARQVVLATGAHERPLVFARNDLPGVMLASAVSTYLRRYAVMPGRRALLFTNNGAAYDSALALHAAGAQVTVVDARAVPDGDGVDRVRAAGIEILAGQVVTEASGGRRVRGAQVQALDADGGLRGPPRELACDLLAVSGGFSPVIHLQSQAGERAVWDDTIAAFLPGPAAQSERSAGGCRGTTDLLSAAIQGWDAGISAARLAGFDGAEDTVTAPPVIVPVSTGGLRALWLVPHPAGPTRAPKQFVDLQNDVAASDLLLAVREGFESIEHVKRYTAMGFGTDQGKTGNINGMGIVAQALGKPIAAVGTTTFRPNYTPVTFGLLAGPELGEAFDPVRTTPMHDWHEAQGAAFEDVGQWKRPWYYPAPGEDLHAAVRREVLGWLERWHQTEWPHLKVYFTTVTDHWATSALAGPRSRDVLRGLCDDVDFDDDAFPFMSYREGTVAGVRARLMRISFSGERGYEINVPAAEGARVWAAIHEAGRPFGITAYGTEAMHVLRAEKGFIIVGQDTDGSVTPIDLGMSAMVAQSKDCIGKRSLSRADTARQDRKQFVGLLTDDPALVLPEGSQVLAGDPGAPLPPVPVPMDGHVTSSYASPTLGRSLALALVRGGLARMGQRVRVALRDGRTATAVIASPVFYDPKGERQHA